MSIVIRVDDEVYLTLRKRYPEALTISSAIRELFLETCPFAWFRSKCFKEATE